MNRSFFGMPTIRLGQVGAFILMVAIPPNHAQNLEFSVTGASPEPWSGADILLTDGTSVRASAADLGLLLTDEIDAFSFGDDEIEPLAAYNFSRIAYSVRSASQGAGGAITLEANGNGAAGDKFQVAVVQTQGGLFNVSPPQRLADATLHNLTPNPGESELEGLSMRRGGSSGFPVYFSVPPGHAAWGPGDIVMVPSAGAAPQLFATAAQLGLTAGDDIDALAIGTVPVTAPPPAVLGPGVVIWVSLTRVSPSSSITTGGDGVIQVYPGSPQVIMNAGVLDLAPGDELDALTGLDPGLRALNAKNVGSSDTQFDLLFSEAVNEADAEDLGNYVMLGGVTLNSATLQADGKTVRFSCSSLKGFTQKTLIVSNVRNLEGNRPIAPNSAVGVVYAAGSISHLLFESISGTRVTDGTSHPDVPGYPSSAALLNLLEYDPAFDPSNYFMIMQGYYSPSVSGFHQFWIAADDNAELYLSTDHNPANKVKIAVEPNWASPRQFLGPPDGGGRDCPEEQCNVSEPIWLEAGQRYYVEIIGKEGTGGDHFAVYVRTPPNGPSPNNPVNGSLPVAGVHLSPYFERLVLSTIKHTANSLSFRALDVGPHIVNPTTVMLMVDNQVVTGLTSVKTGGRTDFTYAPAAPFTAGSHSYMIAVGDTLGNMVTSSGTFTITPLELVRAEADTQWSIALAFNKVLNPASALLEANYDVKIDGNPVEAVDVSFGNPNNAPRNGVLLHLAQKLPETKRVSIAVAGLTSSSGEPFENGTAQISFTTPAIRTGLREEIFASNPTFAFRENMSVPESDGGLVGVTVNSLTDSAYYPFSPQSATVILSTEGNEFDQGENYGRRWSGQLKVSTTAYYHLSIASDDNSELWLGTTDNPNSNVLIAKETAWGNRWDFGSTDAENHSITLYPQGIPLVAGQSYYIEVLHKEGQFGDHVSVAWEVAGTGFKTFIEGENLTHFAGATQAPVNTPPTISEIQNGTTLEDTLRSFTFNISDQEQSSGDLTVTVNSSNQGLIPDGNLILGGSDGNRSLEISPAPDQFGTAEITVTVSDGLVSVTRTFLLTVVPVDDPPTLDALDNVTVAEDSGAQSIALTGISAGPGEDQLVVIAATSSNPDVVSDPTVNYASPNTTGSLTFTPVANASGTAGITVTVTAGTGTAVRTFTVSVTPVDDPPKLAPIPDQTTLEDVALMVPLTITDPDTPLSELTFQASTEDTDLVRDVTFITVGTNTDATVRLVTNSFGSATVSITVSDATSTASGSFNINVIPVCEPPVIGPIADQTASGSTITVVIPVTDADDPVTDLVFSAATAGNSIVSGVTFNPHSDGTVTATFTLFPSANGTESVTVLASDDCESSTRTFNLSAGSTASHASLTVARTSTDLTVTVVGTPGATYLVERTTDLRTWSAFAPVTLNSSGTGLLSLPLTGRDGFFRVRQPPVPGPAPFAYEGYNYAESDPITTNSAGGIGWSGAWVPDVEGQASSHSIRASSLGYVDASGKSLLTSGGRAFYTATNQTGGDIRSFRILAAPRTNGISWVSFLGVRSGPTTNVPTSNPYPQAANLSFYEGGSERFAIGNGSGAISNLWSILPAGSVANVTNAQRSSTPVSELALVVLRVDHNGNNADNLHMWLNPPLGTEPNTNSAAASSTGSYNFSFDRIRPFVGALDAANARPAADFEFDEIRVGGSWDSITPFSGVAMAPVVALNGPDPLPWRRGSSFADPGATASDFSGATLAVTISGAVDINTPGSYFITYSASDSDGNIARVTRTVNVVDSPVANPDIATVIEDSVNTLINVLENDLNVLEPDAALTLVSITDPAHGVAVVTLSGVAYTPDPDFYGSDSFDYIVNDGKGGTAIGTVSVTVTEVNDTPTIASIPNRTIPKETGVAIPISVADIETPLSSLRLTAITTDSNIIDAGRLGFNPENTLLNVFPTAGTLQGSADITVTVTDAEGASASTTFSVSVANITPPTITAVPNLELSQDGSTITYPFVVNDAETFPSLLTVEAASSNPAFVPTLSGSGMNRSVVVTGPATPGGMSTITLTVRDAEGQTATTTFTVSAPNTPPTISKIPNQSIASLGGSTTVLDFTVNDAETLPSLLTVTAVSSNPALIPDSNIQLAGIGTNRTITVHSAPGQKGSAIITVKADDSLKSATESFTVTVPGNAPSIAFPMHSLNTFENMPAGPLSFTIADAETPLANLLLAKTSSNESLLPPANIATDNQQLVISPGANQTGSGLIKFTVTDADGLSTDAEFLVTVIPNPLLTFTRNQDGTLRIEWIGSGSVESATSVLGPWVRVTEATSPYSTTADALARFFRINLPHPDDSPVISPIQQQVLQANTPTPVLSFTVSDNETPSDALTLSARSSNETLVPAGNILLGGSGADRTIFLTPAANQIGTATISVTVTDAGGDTATTSFQLTVGGIPPTPNDFNGDGRSDIIYQDNAGFLAAWFMNGDDLISASLLTPNVSTDPNWRVIGSGNFNADSDADLLFQHTNGDLAVWYMNNITLTTATLLNPLNPGDVNWRAVGVADFNSDQKSDLLFQHTDGRLAAWYMNGTDLVAAALLNPSHPGDINWRAVATADFNNDTNPDILFQHTNGTLAAWYMNGTDLVSGTLLNPSAPGDPNYRAVGATDLNTDGHTDLLFQHRTSADLAVWYMNGPTLVLGKLLNPSNPHGTWRVVAP
jgi:hypothetical protein